MEEINYPAVNPELNILSLVLTAGSVLCHMLKQIRWDSNRTKQFKFTMTAIRNAWQTASKQVFQKQQSNTKQLYSAIVHCYIYFKHKRKIP